MIVVMIMSLGKMPQIINKVTRILLQNPSTKTYFRNKVHSRLLHLSQAYKDSQNIVENKKIQDASTFIDGVLNECKGSAIFAGIGQYYHEKEQDRVIMLNLVDDFLNDYKINIFDSQPVLDCCLKDTDVDMFLDNLKTQSKIPVYNGEVDLINGSSWENGFCLKPFSMFTVDERVLLLHEKHIYINTLGEVQAIPVSDVEYIGLWVSEEPYNERRLMLGLKDLKSRTLVSVERNSTNCDLATLTVDTEWMMKAAALLCVNLSRSGNSNIFLKVSPCLQPINNQWVAMRQKIWMEMIQKNTWEDNDC